MSKKLPNILQQVATAERECWSEHSTLSYIPSLPVATTCSSRSLPLLSNPFYPRYHLLSQFSPLLSQATPPITPRSHPPSLPGHTPLQSQVTPPSLPGHTPLHSQVTPPFPQYPSSFLPVPFPSFPRSHPFLSLLPCLSILVLTPFSPSSRLLL